MITNTGRCAVVVAAVGPLLVIMNPVRWSWRTTPWSDKTAGPRGTRRFELKSAAPQQTSHPHEPQPRTTLPAFRHEVQTFSFRTVPGATCARIGWMFGSHRRWVRRWEWDTFIPKPGPLPHTSHTAATPNTPIDVVRSTTGADQSKLEKARRAPGNLTRVLTRTRGTKFPLDSRPLPWISGRVGPRREGPRGCTQARPFAPAGAPWTP